MRITKDEVLKRLDVQAFYEHFELKLVPSGDEWSARCPFHDDKVASLSINQATGMFNCHGGCQVGGSVFDFMMISDGVDPKDKKNFRPALLKIAAMVGLHEDVKPAKGAVIDLDAMPTANIPDPDSDTKTETSSLFVLPPGKRVEVHDSEEERANNPPIEEAVVDEWHERLLKNPYQLQYLLSKRGITIDTVKRFKLGWTADRYAIPIRDENGTLVNIRKYKPEASGKEMKMVSYTKKSETGDGKTHKYGEARLMPLPIPQGKVLLCEGEMDCLLALQEGFPAVTPTSGAGYWPANDRWSVLFSGRDVVIAYDKDDAGRRGAESIAKRIVDFAHSVAILKWPESMPEKGDITNFLVDLGGDAASLKALMDSAVPYIVVNKTTKEKKDSKEVVLSDSSMAENTGRHVKYRGLVSGKDTTPFIIPKIVNVRCGQENGTKCGGCGLGAIHHGSVTVEFTEENRKTLGLKDCGDAQQRAAIAAAAAINVKGCPFWKRETIEYQNLECLSVIPEINGRLQEITSSEGTSEYVTRTIDVLGHGIKTNNVYEFEGYVYPDVKAQRATTLVGRAEQVEVSIDNFSLTDIEIQRLKIFQPSERESITEKLYSIATEMSKVTRVWGREALQIAYDLSFHSVLGFRCFGEHQPRGWVELFVVGDSGQAKSTMVDRLSLHYRAGQRVNAEQTSGAGLIGGLTKMGDRWQINWGPLVLNDRKLLILDEFSGINEEVAKQMTDIRSSGVAEIIKIHREKAWARTRLIFLSNPKFGRTMGSFEHGVEALMGLFKEAADVRRLDLAISVATGDVSTDRINSRGTDDKCLYMSNDCALLVLWAWSRKPEQIIFEDGFEEAVYGRVKWLASRYSPKIPLIEPADERWKLARVAIAAAAREFSTPDGVTLHVTAAHVHAVAEFINEIYSAPSMSYDSYSNRIMSADRHIENNRGRIKERLRAVTEKPDQLIDLLLTEHYIQPREMEIQLGVERTVVKDVIQFLTQARAIERTGHGYRKRPGLITILKEMEAEGNPPAQGNLLEELQAVSGMADSSTPEADDDMPF